MTLAVKKRYGLSRQMTVWLSQSSCAVSGNGYIVANAEPRVRERFLCIGAYRGVVTLYTATVVTFAICPCPHDAEEAKREDREIECIRELSDVIAETEDSEYHNRRYKFKIRVKWVEPSEHDGLPLLKEPNTCGECRLFLAAVYGCFAAPRLTRLPFYFNNFLGLDVI